MPLFLENAWRIAPLSITPKVKRGVPYPLSVMLRVYCLQLFYNLSDPALEDSLYEIESMRCFAGLRLSDSIPDETTILNVRYFLEKHGLGKLFLKEINSTCSIKACCFAKAPLWMPALFLHRAQPRIKAASATQKCIPPRKAINGTLV